MLAPSSILVHKDLPTTVPIQLIQEISSSDSSPYAFIHHPFWFFCVLFLLLVVKIILLLLF